MRPLLASDLNARIDIRRLIETSDGHGGYTPSLVEIATRLPAEAKAREGREEVDSKVLVPIVYYRFRIRFRDDVQEKDQITLNGLELNIRSVVDPDQRRQQLHILADSAATL